MKFAMAMLLTSCHVKILVTPLNCTDITAPMTVPVTVPVTAPVTAIITAVMTTFMVEDCLVKSIGEYLMRSFDQQ
jgi:hypothetical protein